MKLELIRHAFIPQVDHYELKFTAQEVATMRRAENIADRARQLCRAKFGDDFELSEWDMELAHVEQGVRALLEENIDLGMP